MIRKLHLALSLLLLPACLDTRSPRPDPDFARDSGPRREISAGDIPFLNPERLEERGFEIDWVAEMPEGKRLRSVHLPLDYPYPATIYAETPDFMLHALDRSSGHLQWMDWVGRPIRGTPMEGASYLLVQADDRLCCFDIRRVEFTGKPRGQLTWQVPLPFRPSTSVVHNDAYAAFGTLDGRLQVIDLEPLHRQADATARGDRVGVRAHAPIAWWRQTEAPIAVRPIVQAWSVRNSVIFTNESGILRSRSIRAYDAEDPSPWVFPARGRAGTIRGEVFLHTSAEETDRGTVYISYCIFGDAENHTLYIVRSDTGSLQGKIVLPGPVESTPTAVGSTPEGLRIYVNITGEGFHQIVNPEPDPDWPRLRRIIRDEENEVLGETDVKYRWPLASRWWTKEADTFLMEGERAVYLLDSRTREIVAVDKTSDGEARILWREPTTGIDFLLPDRCAPEGTFQPVFDFTRAQWRIQQIPPGRSRLFVASRQGFVAAIRER